jgi:hypothetical protein
MYVEGCPRTCELEAKKQRRQTQAYRDLRVSGAALGPVPVEKPEASAIGEPVARGEDVPF